MYYIRYTHTDDDDDDDDNDDDDDDIDDNDDNDDNDTLIYYSIDILYKKEEYNGYQTLVMHNPFSRYSETHIIHNCRLFIMSVTPLTIIFKWCCIIGTEQLKKLQ